MSDHPRDRFDLAPHQDAERAFTDALSRGRLHHAWMLTGVEGVGKATFAYRAARRLLGAEPDPSRGGWIRISSKRWIAAWWARTSRISP